MPAVLRTAIKETHCIILYVFSVTARYVGLFWATALTRVGAVSPVKKCLGSRIFA